MSASSTLGAHEAGKFVEKLTRKERKRRETRARIIAATEQLIGTRPLDELTISEITEAADVGHGTFYLHFKTKYEVVVSIVYEHAAQWDEAIHDSLQDVDDPAEIVSRSARQIARLMLNDPLCQWFFQQSGVPAQEMREATGRFFARDINLGLESGRFQVPDLELAISYLFGGVANALVSLIDQESSDEAIDGIIEMMLRVLGISADEAREISQRPLQPLQFAS